MYIWFRSHQANSIITLVVDVIVMEVVDCQYVSGSKPQPNNNETEGHLR